MRNLAEQSTYEERLRFRVLCCGPDAVEASIAMMERYDPESLEEACSVLLGDGELPPGCHEVVIDAWDRYFHMRDMSWD
ncbi:MAG: hypothetical protein AB7V58_00205 [Solirubrobacterales bacterium]